MLFSLALVAAHSPHQLPNDYLDFASRHADRGQPIGAKELSLALSDADATRPVRLDLDRWELHERIVQELNIDFLLDDPKHGKRAVRVERELRRSGFTERRLVFEDPEIGSFVATLLVPPGDGPHPAELDIVDSERIGVLSHSGGSSIANLLVRISDGVAAQVIDYRVDFRNLCGGRRIHCETLPGLSHLAVNINEGASLPIPRKLVPYGFQEPVVRREIEAFFEQTLAL